MPRSPEPARQQILDAALCLFATQGIAGVSLREIRLGAKQGNAGALAVSLRDQGRPAARAARARAAVARGPQARSAGSGGAGARHDDVRSVAAVFVLPYAQLATGTEHERHVVQFLSQLHDDVSFSLEEIQELLGDTAAGDAGRLLSERLGTQLGERGARRRGFRSRPAASCMPPRSGREGERREHRMSDETFRSNLVDMFVGALTAPVGDRQPQGRH